MKLSRRRIGSLVFLAVGLAIAMALGQLAPSEQHIHVILGNRAPEVTAVTLQYVAGAGSGEIADETSFRYEAGKAPRIVSHDPKLSTGEYRLTVDVEMREIRRSVERQVTLKGGSTQVDVANALEHD